MLNLFTLLRLPWVSHGWNMWMKSCALLVYLAIVYLKCRVLLHNTSH
ncbi:unnamed protein product [Brassica oleracea]